MAEYYPLLAKAVGSLPNSTPETRRIVYERARKALIGQLRTYHPPVPEEDIEAQSLDLDRAIERLETEIAAAPPAAPEPAKADQPAAPPAPAAPPPVLPPPVAAAPSGALGPTTARKPIAPLRPRVPRPPLAAEGAKPPGLKLPEPRPADPTTTTAEPEPKPAEPGREISGVPIPPEPVDTSSEPAVRARLETQRPIAPQPPAAKAPKRRMWIIPAGIAAVFALVGIAAWKLRVKPETVARTQPAVTQPQDTGKIADRVGGKASSDDQAAPQPSQAPAPESAAPPPSPGEQAAAPAETPAPAAETPAPAQQTPPAANPEVPVAYRAALLVEASGSPSKVQTFPGTVVWKLNNVNNGPGDSVGLSVEADIDLPEDKMKAAVVFEKNTDPSLPASHTIKVRFTVAPGSYSGDIKQINVPQMRGESNSDGEALAGVTVPVIQNSFLVGLSPGNAETANLRLVADLPWIDVPMLLTSGKIAKLTFEKGSAGQRDIAEAMSYWQKP